MKLAVIPARGGSKRIPRKNIKPFAGRPIIAWSIEAALDSGIFDHVVVSTDDSEIANTALELGAEVPFVRPRELSGDLTATVPVVAHACTWVERHWGPVASACCIYATAPFITSEDIVTAEKILRNSHADYAFPVTSFPFPIQRAVRLQGTERMEMFYPEHANTRSQDLIEAFHDVGQFYWGKAEAWTQGRSIIGPDAAPLVIPRHRAQDIDTPEDWCREELMFQVLHQLDGSVSM